VNLKELQNAYKAFLANEAGKHFMTSAKDVRQDNLSTAMNNNSLDHLARAKGNQEIIDLIENVINTKEAEPK